MNFTAYPLDSIGLVRAYSELPSMSVSTISLAVFISPELAVSSSCHTLFSKPHVKKNLVLVAIDEVHCVLEWLLLF